MGLLDDAIREHLELKRRRGADPDEVARQENEALGDPRAPAPEAEDGAFADPEVTAVTPPVAEEEPLTELDEPEAAGAFEPELDPEAEPEPYDEPRDEAPAAAAAPPAPEPWLPDEPPRPPAPEPEPAPAAEAADPDADEDVLEETPDFLQETPEHDRLWFEQKPPRDFDFDS
jgi:hypothetical protein